MKEIESVQIDPETQSDKLHRQMAYAFSLAFLFSLANSLAEEAKAHQAIDIGLSVAVVVTVLWVMVVLLRTAQVAKAAGGSIIEKCEADERIVSIREKAFVHGFTAVMVFNILLLVLPETIRPGGDFGPYFTIGIGIVASLISYNRQNR